MRSPAFNLSGGTGWQPEPEPEPEPEPDIVFQGEQDYTAILTMSEALKPQTVVAENFSLCNNGEELEIQEALYRPETKQVFLKLSKMALSSPDCTVSMKDVCSLAGEVVTEPTGIKLQSEQFCNVFGMNVKAIQLFSNDGQIINPVEGEPLAIVVTVVNSGKARKSGTLRVYLSDSPQRNLCEPRTIALEKGFMGKYRFDLPSGIADGQTGTICAELN